MTTGRFWSVWRKGTHILEPVAPLFLRLRLRRGKEDETRWRERLGLSDRQRPKGPLAWIHGASVGEALAILPLAEALNTAGFQVLVTTGTVSSSRVVADRLPPGAQHQFMPLDLPGAVDRFLDRWQPDLCCFTESELWPVMIFELHRRQIPSALVNGRLSVRSHRRWRRARAPAAALLRVFHVIAAQSEADATRFRDLGATAVTMTGTVKFDGPAPPADPVELERLKDLVGARSIWVAASIHPGEEQACLDAHRTLARTIPDVLTVVVPRHSPRGAEILQAAADLGIAAQRRGAGEDPDRSTGVYVADTMGELGLFYRLGRCTFVGKSLPPELGGQNPIEPAKLGVPVLHGPAVTNFIDVYQALDATGGSVAVTDAAGLAAAVEPLLHDVGECERRGRHLLTAVEALSGATVRTVQALRPLIEAALAKRSPT